MPVHRFDGSEWSHSFGRVWNGAWSDENDNMWAWDGAEWQLIQPLEAVGPGGLLPPENLTITSLGSNNVEITWTDPVQLTEDPTNVQYRIPEITSVLTEVVYPTDIFSHESLFPETPYTFEVRYVRREGGEVVASSEIVAISFVTLMLAVGNPAEDPGGTGGQSIIPIRPPINPGPVGGPGCWWNWELFIVNQTTLAWESTGITGTHAGNVVNFHYDLDTLDKSRTYRFEFCENCGGVMGDCNFGQPFNGTNWDSVCGGIPPSPSLATAITADAIWAMPEICTIAGRQVIIDKVSGIELTTGSGFLMWMVDPDGEHIVVAKASGGGLWHAALPAVGTAIQPGHDFSIMFDLLYTELEAADPGSHVHLSIGSAHFISVIVSGSGYRIEAKFVKSGGGFITLTSPLYAHEDSYHDVVLRWDDNGPKELFVDGDLAASDTSGDGIAAGSLITYGMDMLVYGRTRRHFGWARLLTEFEISQIHEPSITAWWGESFVERRLFNVRLGGERKVILAGAAGYSGPRGGALIGTMPSDQYVLSVGAAGGSADSIPHTEGWGFGGYGGDYAIYGGSINGTNAHGGGRTELRTGNGRATAVVIAPGGGGSSNGGAGGQGGFPDGQPATTGGGGFSGFTGTGGTASSYGVGGAGYAGGNSGGDGDMHAGTIGATGSGIGSGGRGGNGSVSFGSGGMGGGGGAGKHGGGGGAGGNGSSVEGRGAGGGSGDGSGLATTASLLSGVNGGHGFAAMQILADYSPTVDSFINDHNPAVYVPGEECQRVGAIVVTDVMSGKPFFDRGVATIYDGVASNISGQIQGQVSGGRPAIHVNRSSQVDFQMRAVDAVGVPWNPPVLNAGHGWAVEWTSEVIAGTNAMGPGCSSNTTPGVYDSATGNQLPWRCWADATHIYLALATTGLSTIVTPQATFSSRAVTQITRYGISYDPSTDTFSFFRSDGTTTLSGTQTRTAAGVPTTGQFNLQSWRPLLHSSTGGSDEAKVRDVAVFDHHRSQAAFDLGATLLLGAGSGVTNATGGNQIYVDDGWVYHEFTANGTFTPVTTKTCQIMVLGAGGGSGPGGVGVSYPEGGAGGVMRTFVGVNISTPTAITIGVGGAAGVAGGTTTMAGLTPATGGESGGTDGVGEGGDNADFNGTSKSGTAPGGSAGAGASAIGLDGGNGAEWPVGSGRIWAPGGSGMVGGANGQGYAGANSGAGAAAGQGGGQSGRVIIRYPA